MQHRTSQTRAHSFRHGFTLIELLVVIAIIAILAAILFPVFAQARSKARQTACLSNMKQIGIGLYLYTQDFDETLPGNSSVAVGAAQALGWMTPVIPGNVDTINSIPRDIQPYVKNLAIFVCPEAISRAATSSPSPGYANPVPSPPGGNSSYLFNGLPMFRSIAVIPTPANTIFVHEENQYQRYTSIRPYQKASDGKMYGCNWSSYDNIHNAGGALLYCDTHAKWKKKTAIGFDELGCVTNPPDMKLGESGTIAVGNTGFPPAF